MSLRERSCPAWHDTVLFWCCVKHSNVIGVFWVSGRSQPHLHEQWSYHWEQFVEMRCIRSLWLTQSKSHSHSRSARRAVTSHLGCHPQHASSPEVWGRSLVLKKRLHRHLHRTTTLVPSTGERRHTPPRHLHRDHFRYIFQGCLLHSR
jgi:hypothetical protein